MTQNQNLAKKGVGYYNENNRNNEDNKNNIPETKNGFLSSFVEPAAEAATISPDTSVSLSCPPAPDRLLVSNQEPTPFDENMVKRALIQLFDNGEDSYQRYKIKLKLNLIDNSDPEFVASLTKDMRNFKKYIPDEGRETVVQFAKEVTSFTKKHYNCKPYIGKFHLNQGRGRNVSNQIEPETAVAIWWDPDNRGWNGCLMFYNWTMDFNLFSDYLKPNQKAAGCRGQDLWINKKYDQRIKPLTWAEQQRLKNQNC